MVSKPNPAVPVNPEASDNPAPLNTENAEYSILDVFDGCRSVEKLDCHSSCPAPEDEPLIQLSKSPVERSPTDQLKENGTDAEVPGDIQEFDILSKDSSGDFGQRASYLEDMTEIKLHIQREVKVYTADRCKKINDYIDKAVEDIKTEWTMIQETVHEDNTHGDVKEVPMNKNQSAEAIGTATGSRKQRFIPESEEHKCWRGEEDFVNWNTPFTPGTVTAENATIHEFQLCNVNGPDSFYVRVLNPKPNLQ